MSLVGTMKDLEAANKALTEKIAALTAESETVKKTHDGALAALQNQIVDRDTKIADLIKQASAAAQAADEAAKARAALDARVAQLTAELDKARTALANPAFADAAALGQKTPPKDPGDAPARMTAEQFQAKYAAEKDPAKRAAMWREYMNVK